MTYVKSMKNCFFFLFRFYFIFRFAHGNENDGFKMFEEKFLRETIRNFPYKQCPLLQQLVRLIAPISIVNFIKIFIYHITNIRNFRVRILPL